MIQRYGHTINLKAWLPFIAALVVLCFSLSSLFINLGNAMQVSAASESSTTPVTSASTLSAKVTLDNLGTGTGGSFRPGDTIQFVVEVKDTGTAALQDVLVTEKLAGATFTADTADTPAYTIDKDGVAHITALAAGKSVKLKASYKVTDADAAAGSVKNKVEASLSATVDPVKSDELSVPTEATPTPDPDPDPTPTPTNPTVTNFNIFWYNGGEYSTSSPSIDSKGATVQLHTLLTWSNTTQSVDASAQNITWSTSDADVATVSQSGIVVPQGKNGTVTITAVDSSCNRSSSLDITFTNQEEKTDIRVYTDDGGLIPEAGTGSTVSISQRGSTNAQGLYAEIDYDGQTLSSRDGSGAFDFQVENIEIANCYYPNSGSTYVWATDTGYDGATQLIVTITLDGNKYLRYVPLNVNTGSEWAEGDGSGVVPSQLTVSVSWEDDPNPTNPTTTTHTYTMDQLDQMSNEYHTYTIIGDPTSTKRYAYQTARGVRLIALLNDCGIYENDVKYIDCKATDSVAVNSSTMGMSFFLDSRYYYPNYYLGRNTTNPVTVPAMIAVASKVYWNASAETVASKVDTYADLGSTDGKAPRLCLGAVSPKITGGKISVSNVETIHVVLSGAPPTGDDTNPDDGNGGGNGGGGTGGGSGGGSGSGSGSGNGSGATGTNGVSATGSGAGTTAANMVNGTAGANAGGADIESDATENDTGGGGTSDEGSESTGARTWHVYQMMSTAKTDVPITEQENPWLPWLWPIVDVILAAGALRYLIWYMREKRPPTVPLAWQA